MHVHVLTGAGNLGDMIVGIVVAVSLVLGPGSIFAEISKCRRTNKSWKVLFYGSAVYYAFLLPTLLYSGKDAITKVAFWLS